MVLNIEQYDPIIGNDLKLYIVYLYKKYGNLVIDLFEMLNQLMFDFVFTKVTLKVCLLFMEMFDGMESI